MNPTHELMAVRPKRERTETLILRALAGAGRALLTSEVVERVERNRGAVDRVLRELEGEGAVSQGGGTPHRKMWWVTEAGRLSLESRTTNPGQYDGSTTNRTTMGPRTVHSSPGGAKATTTTLLPSYDESRLPYDGLLRELHGIRVALEKLTNGSTNDREPKDLWRDDDLTAEQRKDVEYFCETTKAKTPNLGRWAANRYKLDPEFQKLCRTRREAAEKRASSSSPSSSVTWAGARRQQLEELVARGGAPVEILAAARRELEELRKRGA